MFILTVKGISADANTHKTKGPTSLIKARHSNEIVICNYKRDYKEKFVYQLLFYDVEKNKITNNIILKFSSSVPGFPLLLNSKRELLLYTGQQEKDSLILERIKYGIKDHSFTSKRVLTIKDDRHISQKRNADDPMYRLISISKSGKELFFQRYLMHSSGGCSFAVYRFVKEKGKESLRKILKIDREKYNDLSYAKTLLSPDGTKILYFGHHKTTSLNIIDVASGNVKKLLKTPRIDSSRAAWSSSGDEIMYIAGEKIFVVNIHSGKKRMIYDKTEPSFSGAPFEWVEDGAIVNYDRGAVFIPIDKSLSTGIVNIEDRKGIISSVDCYDNKLIFITKSEKSIVINIYNIATGEFTGKVIGTDKFSTDGIFNCRWLRPDSDTIIKDGYPVIDFITPLIDSGMRSR